MSGESALQVVAVAERVLGEPQCPSAAQTALEANVSVWDIAREARISPSLSCWYLSRSPRFLELWPRISSRHRYRIVTVQVAPASTEPVLPYATALSV
jgi:hypothetical protein